MVLTKSPAQEGKKTLVKYIKKYLLVIIFALFSPDLSIDSYSWHMHFTDSANEAFAAHGVSKPLFLELQNGRDKTQAHKHKAKMITNSDRKQHTADRAFCQKDVRNMGTLFSNSGAS